MENANKQEKRKSIKRQIIVFSISLFFIILLGGGTVFVLSMQQIVESGTGQELSRDAQVERIKLEASVNGEIALALKMATSPLIIQHFQDPADSDIRRIAFAEIVGYQTAFKSNTVFWASDVDKEFYFDENNHYTIDINNPDNYWYRMTLYETEKYNFNINYNPEIQKIMLWINAPVFDSRRNPIGLVGTGIDLTEFIDSIYRNFTNTKSLYFFNASGEITGARDTSLITNKVTIDKALGETGAEILKRAKELKPDETVHYSAHDGEIAIDRIPSLDWYIIVIQQIGMADILSSSMTVLFVAMIAMVAAILIIFYIFINRMIKPMDYMVKALEHISADWDLTQQLQLHRNDEIGTLGKFFNTTFEKMRTLLLSIKRETVALSDTGSELTAYMSTTKTDVENISENIQMMMKNVLNQADKVNSATGSMERIIGGLNNLNEHISVQADSVAQSSSAIEEMLANIQSVTQTLIKNTENIKTLAKTSEAGRIDVQKVSTDIQEIARESEGLLEINAVMENIASQTNLLSMNAAIEAAHAGESGKGFAVVAGEIRKLAENSTAQSKTISDVLKKIKKSIDAISKSTAIVLERFGNIETEVETVSTQESQIRNAMEEQGVGSRQILEAITQLNSVTNMVRRSSADMTTESNDVLQQSKALKTITTEVADGMDQMTQNTEGIANAITRVQEISMENKENIDTLSTDISRFKVE